MENIYIARFTGASGAEYILAVYADSEQNAKTYIIDHYQVRENDIEVKKLAIVNGVQVLFD